MPAQGRLGPSNAGRIQGPKLVSEDRIARTALLLTLAVLCSLTWRKWGYLPIDSGREMYVPAAISAGKRLYFDLWYPYPPLIPYWHAALFRLFGVHLGVLIGAGVTVVGIITLLLYSVSRVFLPVWFSFAVVWAFLLQAFEVNLFNYILPYSYSAAYGSMFSLLLLWLLLRQQIAAAGFLTGLMMLTKLEFGVAGYAALICALIIEGIRTKSIRTTGRSLCACIPGTILWLAIYGWYLYAMGADAFLGQNLSILPSSHFQQHFAKLWNETTGLVLSPRALAISAVRGLAGFGVLVGFVVLAARSKIAGWILAAVALCLCAIHLAATMAHVADGTPIDRLAVKALHPLFFNSGMVWVGLVVFGMAAVTWKRRNPQQSKIVLCALAMACGLRVLTKIAPSGYSIFFDVLIYLVLLVGLYSASKQFSVNLDGAFGKAAAGILCLSVLTLTLEYYPVQQRSFMVSSDRGTLFTTPEIGKGFSQTLTFLESARRRSQPVLVIPEDTSLYFFSGTIAPSRWYIVTPQVLPPGEPTAKYIQELDRADLRYVIVSDRATPEFGLPVFGVDYGQEILAWIKKNFHVVKRIGDYEPVAFPREWGALVYERISP
jgi:hypothetical protein